MQGALKVRLAVPQGLTAITPAVRPSDKAPRPTVVVWVGKSLTAGAVREVVSAKRPAVKGPVLIKLVGVTDRSGAEALYGHEIYVQPATRAPLESDEYFIDDLIGLKVVTDQGKPLGTLTKVIQNPANDVYETDLGALIPAVKAFIVSLDLLEKQMTVKDDPGLMPEPKPTVQAVSKP